MAFFVVTDDGDKAEEDEDRLSAHEYATEAEARAFEDGVNFVNDSALCVVGIFECDSEEDAILLSEGLY